jgi:putative membrane protein
MNTIIMNIKKARLGAAITAITLLAGNAFGQAPQEFETTKSIGHALLMSVVFATTAMALLFVAFKIFDWATPRIDIQKELLNNNIAVAILSAAVILGVSLIVAVSIM